MPFVTYETHLLHIEVYLAIRYGMYAAEELIAPLKEYILSGDAPMEFSDGFCHTEPLETANAIRIESTDEANMDRLTELYLRHSILRRSRA